MPLDASLRGGSIELMEQVLHIEGRDFRLIVPRDVEAIMEMYIEAGVPLLFTTTVQESGVT